ncbi:hypothetical protein UlMin_001074 [Ulmus minor]
MALFENSQELQNPAIVLDALFCEEEGFEDDLGEKGIEESQNCEEIGKKQSFSHLGLLSFTLLLDDLVVWFLCQRSVLDELLGIEDRGFIFGLPIALAIGAKFVPLRKPKKFSGEVIFEEYTLEYGKDLHEMHIGAIQPGEHALVVDDLIAIGGTLCPAMNILEHAGAEVVECACVIELPDLQGQKKLKGKPLYILVESH